MARTSTSWKKGQPPANPSGINGHSTPAWVAKLRGEPSVSATKKLQASADAGEPWAVTLLLAYAWGKPREAAIDLAEVSTQELCAELERRDAADDAARAKEQAAIAHQEDQAKH